MAIQKKVKFEGNTYNLGNKDRVSAQAAWDVNGPIKSTYLEKELAYGGAYDPDGLTTTAKTDANVASGFTISDDTVIDSAMGSATGTPGTITLPSATVGNYVVWRQTDEWDGASKTLNIDVASGDFFAGDDTLCIGTMITAQCDVSAATDTRLALTNAATSNYGWGAVGDSIVFFCRTAGFWNVNIPESTGHGTSAGGTVAFSAP
tara:strand:- start:1683 stop:2297 length:615 start_codon:yes stop_codon:yes gene_type:complete